MKTLMKHFGIALTLCLLLGCGQAPAPETASAPEPQPLPRDESHRFPKEGLVKTSIVESHLLDRDFLPSGNLAEYSHYGKAYSLFLTVVETPEKAGFLAYDIRAQFTDPKFVPNFGGYSGMEGGQPWFVFAKNRTVAGIVGLPLDEAEQLARGFAAHLE